MKEIEPHIADVREKYKNDKQQQALKTMELYKKHGINPFSGFFMLFVQFPIILALYWVFWKGLKNGINPLDLYSFIEPLPTLNMYFLNLFDLGSKSLILAGLAAFTQYLQIHYATPLVSKQTNTNVSTKPSFKDEFMKSFSFQMKYGLPVVVFFVSYTISGVVALYWSASNIFTILHQLYVRHQSQSSSQKTSL